MPDLYLNTHRRTRITQATTSDKMFHQPTRLTQLNTFHHGPTMEIIFRSMAKLSINAIKSNHPILGSKRYWQWLKNQLPPRALRRLVSKLSIIVKTSIFLSLTWRMQLAVLSPSNILKITAREWKWAPMTISNKVSYLTTLISTITKSNLLWIPNKRKIIPNIWRPWEILPKQYLS